MIIRKTTIVETIIQVTSPLSTVGSGRVIPASCAHAAPAAVIEAAPRILRYSAPRALGQAPALQLEAAPRGQMIDLFA